MSGSVAAKEVVLAEVGAAAALVGFVLVFLGILVTTYQTLLGSLGRPALARLRLTAWAALAVAATGLLAIVLGCAWLLAGGGHVLYMTTAIVFFLELAAVLAIAIVSSSILLR